MVAEFYSATFIPINEEEIRHFEEKEKITFSPEYKAFLLEHNGEEFMGYHQVLVPPEDDIEYATTLEMIMVPFADLADCWSDDYGYSEKFDAIRCICRTLTGYGGIYMGFKPPYFGKVFYSDRVDFVFLAETLPEFFDMLTIKESEEG